jgi:L-ascorbate metabolism protein UlaG (beta-lactamase superfamily)
MPSVYCFGERAAERQPSNDQQSGDSAMTVVPASTWLTIRVVASALALAVVASVVPGEGYAQSTQADSAQITYIGNEGFFVSHAGRGVLIDALVRRGIPPYVKAPDEQRERIETAAPPFDNVHLVLATHDHADHFDAGAVWRHLDNRELSVFVSTSKAVARVRATPSTPDLEERTHVADPPEGQRAKFAVEGINLDVLNLHHGRDRNPPVASLGFLVDIEGFRILHLGDTEVSVEELLVYGLAEESIDVAFVPYWQLNGSNGRRFIEEAIAPKHIVAMHIPAANAAASYFAPAGSLQQLKEQLEEAYPGIIIFQEPLESVKLEPR